LYFFITGFKINLKRIIKNPLFFCALLIMTALAACAFFLRGGGAFAVNVGIMPREPDALTDKATEALSQNRQINFIIFDASEEDEMTQMVKSRRLECAYIFEAGVMEAVRQERFDNIITLVVSPATVASGVINEAVFAALMRPAAEMLSARVTSDMFGLDITALEDEFALAIEGYNANGVFMEPVFLYENSYIADARDIFAIRAFHGVLITVLFIFSYFLMPIFISDKKNGLFKLLRPAKTAVYYLAQFAAGFLSAFLLGIFAILLLKIFAPAALLPLWKEILALFVYLATVQLIFVLCVLIIKSPEPLYAGFIFILLIQIIFGNLFIDLREINAALGRGQILPSAYYMDYLLR